MVMNCELMEGGVPAPDIVGREFVRQYYTLLNEAPQHAHRFYNSTSFFVHGTMGKPAIGQVEIHQRIQQLNFRDCHAKIQRVDSQITLGNGVLVQVSGELSNDGLPMRRFSQTFVLGTQSPKKYYVHNDIFRYQDTLCDEDGEELAELDMDQPELAQNYYAPVSMEPPLVTPGLNVNAPPHTVNVNGTGPSGVNHRADHLEMMQEIVPEPQPVPPVQTLPQVNGGPQHSSIETSPSSLGGRSATAMSTVEDSPPQQVPEINNKDTYEEQYQPPVEDSKKTYANLLRGNQTRGPMPPRVPRAAPPQAVAPSTPPTAPAAAPPAAAPVRSDPAPDLPSGGPNVRYPDSQQIFMGNIPPDCAEDDLRPLFEEFGRVVDVRININRREPNSRNYGFVTFEDSSAVSQCLNAKHVMYKDIAINVEEKKRQKFNHDMSSGRGQNGRGRGPGPRGPPRGPGSFSRGPPPSGPRPPYKR